MWSVMLHESTEVGLSIVAFLLQVQVSGSVIDCRMVYRVVPVGIIDCAVMRVAVRTDSLYLCTVFPNGQFGTILDVSLDQHHAVRLTEPFGRTVTGFFVHLHLFPSIAGFVDMPLQD